MDEELQTLQIKLALKFADEGKVFLGQRRAFHGVHNAIAYLVHSPQLREEVFFFVRSHVFGNKLFQDRPLFREDLFEVYEGRIAIRLVCGFFVSRPSRGALLVDFLRNSLPPPLISTIPILIL